MEMERELLVAKFSTSEKKRKSFRCRERSKIGKDCQKKSKGFVINNQSGVINYLVCG